MNIKEIKGMVLSDSEKAAYRLSAKNIVKLGTAGCVRALEAKGGDQATALAAMLESQPGAALMSAAMGGVLTAMPQFQGDVRVQTLATELRVNGMATLGNSLVDAIAASFGPSLGSLLESLPMPQAQAEEDEEIAVSEPYLAEIG